MPNDIFALYDTFREKSLSQRRLTVQNIIPIIQSFQSHAATKVELLGKSFENRPIYTLSLGSGNKKVLLWSQMHGNEATATMAIFDLLKFLTSENDQFELLRTEILRQTNLCFLPMLNPDGAARFQRRNAQEIDLNRDALAKQAPESLLLHDLINTFDPHFAFNLHDQNTRYSAGQSQFQASLSFLASPYDTARSVNETRQVAMQLILKMQETLSPYVANHIARFKDDFEPRAFGDNVQKRGTSLVLIDTGGFPNDLEKQFLRKLNFIAILAGLESIANDSFRKENVARYDCIPTNAEALFDLLIRNVQFKQGFRADIGINIDEINLSEPLTYCRRGYIEDLGDLSSKYGIEEIDAAGMLFEDAKELAEEVAHIEELDNLNTADLLRKGIAFVKVRNNPYPGDRFFYGGPLHALFDESAPHQFHGVERGATFFLRDGPDLRFAIINGSLTDLRNITS